MPAFAYPEHYIACFGEFVGNGNPCRRTKPDHRTTETNGIGQHSPIVMTLGKTQFCERNIVEDSGNKTKDKCGGPMRLGQCSTGNQ